MSNKLKKITIYTDGACKGNPGVGGWGAILLYKKIEKEIFGGQKESTNNRMELMAVVKALSILKVPCYVDLYTDSNYVRNGIMLWLLDWISKDWYKSSKRLIKNIDLWKKIHLFCQRHTIKCHWVKGHSTNALNNRADGLANMGVDQIINNKD